MNKPENHPENTLEFATIVSFRKGDKIAVQKIYEHFAPTVLYIAKAEPVKLGGLSVTFVCEVFYCAWNERNKIEFASVDQFDDWFRSIITLTAMRHLRMKFDKDSTKIERYAMDKPLFANPVSEKERCPEWDWIKQYVFTKNPDQIYHSHD